ncbi:MAG: choice-of-anchor C family protein [Desulfobaccales bacterium]|jgi:choice-of-anchor C domain-containing protein
MKKLILLLALAIPLIFAPAAGANLILNGNFELGITDPATYPGSFTTIYAGGSTSITDWTVTANSVDYIGTYWIAPTGSLSIDMTGTPGNPTLPGNGTLVSNAFTTVVGDNYAVSFDMSGNFMIPDATYRKMKVEVAGASPTFTFNWFPLWSQANMGWQTESFLFTANSTETTLTFISLSTNNYCGPVLADVTVNAAPLPPSVLLLGSGLVGLAGLGWRWRRKTA